MTSTRFARVSTLVTVLAIGVAVAAMSTASHGTADSTRISGQLVVAVADDFAGNSTTVDIAVQTASGAVQLIVGADQQQTVMHLAGREVVVQGTPTGDGLNVTSVTPVGPEPAPPAGGAAAVKHRRIAVVLLRLNGSVTDEFPVQDAQDAFFDATDSVKAWFAEASSGAESVTGQVYGWYSSTLSSCPVGGSAIAPALQQAAAHAAADGYLAANFDNLVVYTPSIASCDYGGIAYTPGKGVHLNGYMTIPYTAHELGHNLGLGHAGSLNCFGVTLGPSCARDDYGDPYDTMGDGIHTYQGANKLALGWMPANQSRTVAAGTQTITLTPSETPVAGSTELIKIPLPNGRSYAVELRQSHGIFDQGLFGVWIRIIGPYRFADTTLLDMQPGTATVADGNLGTGMTFNDPSNQIKVTTLSDNGTNALIRVIRPAKAPSAPRKVTTKIGNGRATVNWLAPTTNGGAPINSYEIVPFRKGVRQTAIVQQSAALSRTLIGLTNGMTYTFKVRAHNAKGWSSLSAASPVITVGAPLPPTAVIATKVAPGSLKLTFHVAANNGAAISRYAATCKSGNGGTLKNGTAKSSPISIKGLTKGRSYRCTVKATNSRGTGPASAATAAVVA